jgi:hypothetical protein
MCILAFSDPARSVANRCRRVLFLALGLTMVPGVTAQDSPQQHSVLATAVVQTLPSQITLSWPADLAAKFYTVSRKSADGDAWSTLSTLPSNATNFTDSAVIVGQAYEYQLFKTNSTYAGYGYLQAGIELPLVDSRGKIVLVLSQMVATDLTAELQQLEQDLVGDGWTVLRHDVNPIDSPASVKQLIKTDYDADPANVRALFLLGAIPIPYSGDVAPDGHPNHQGAWPADVYYGELHKQWTDLSVTSTNAERARNWNLPGDGRFDQGAPPGEVNLQIGRVDLSNLTCFSNKDPSRSEKDLLRQYLAKDHNFRHGRLQVPRRGLICDNFPDKGTDPVAGSAWRNYSGFFGPQALTEVGWSNYFPTVTREAYLWTFASGGGQYYTCTGVGSSDDFALQDPKAVFTMWLGSYFGDWDNESNFLRAVLGSTTYTLTSSYSGFPHWLYHPMALGQTIGHCARLTQNNRAGGLYPPFNEGAGLIHIALLGDPTLRMFPVPPASAPTLARTTRGFRLSWSPSTDDAVRGYHVYRANSASGPFSRTTGATPLVATSFVDTPPADVTTYMIRAVKLETTSSGTFWNVSQGVFVPLSSAVDSTQGDPSLTIRRDAPAVVQLQVLGDPSQTYSLEASPDLHGWNVLSNRLSGDAGAFLDPVPVETHQRFYRARLNP